MLGQLRRLRQEPRRHTDQSGLTICKASRQLLGTLIPGIIDNNASQILNSNELQPKVDIRSLMVEAGRDRRIFKEAGAARIYSHCLCDVQHRAVLLAVIREEIAALSRQINN